MDTTSSRSLMPRVLGVFTLSLLVVLVGMYIGQYIPPMVMIPLMILEVGLIIAAVVFRKKKALGYPLLTAFMLISGMTLYSVLAVYVSVLGAGTVTKAFVLASATFAAAAVYATLTKRDFSFLGGFLFMSVIALVVLGLLGIFFPFHGMMETVISAFGVFVFIGYTLYDFNKMAKAGFSEDEIPLIVMNIYLDFVNLFLYILRMITSLSKN